MSYIPRDAWMNGARPDGQGGMFHGAQAESVDVRSAALQRTIEQQAELIRSLQAALRQIGAERDALLAKLRQVGAPAPASMSTVSAPPARVVRRSRSPAADPGASASPAAGSDDEAQVQFIVPEDDEGFEEG